MKWTGCGDSPLHAFHVQGQFSTVPRLSSQFTPDPGYPPDPRSLRLPLRQFMLSDLQLQINDVQSNNGANGKNETL